VVRRTHPPHRNLDAWRFGWLPYVDEKERHRRPTARDLNRHTTLGSLHFMIRRGGTQAEGKERRATLDNDDESTIRGD
jgi:hypothetical protein